MKTIKKILKPIYLFFMKIYYRIKKGVIIGKNSVFNTKTLFEGNSYIYNNVDVSNSYIGDSTYICDNSIINNTYIGKYCCIAKNVNVIIGQHPTKKHVSIHPTFYSTQKQSGFTYVEKDLYVEYKTINNNYSIKIGNDVWIGQNASIMEGITIGDGAIIGACSVVTRNVPPYAIVVGSPARVIKYRFNKKEINYLLKDKWWNKDKKWIINNKKIFLDIKKYIKK